MEANEILFNVFYGWCLILNGIMSYLKYDFVLRFSQVQRRTWVPVFVVTHCMFTFLAMKGYVEGAWPTFFDVGMLCVFGCLSGGARWKQTINPIVIVLVIACFSEGCQTLVMRPAATNITKTSLGWTLQFLVPLAGMLLFFLLLREISKRYGNLGGQLAASYLAVFLLPCVFMIFVVRINLGLDHTVRESFPLSLGSHPEAASVAWLLGTIATFFVFLHVFSKVTLLSKLQADTMWMENQMHKQRIYIDEAKKRNEKYRSFQHDIHNHMLVLSGLLGERNYDRAEKYAERLASDSCKLLQQVATGNAVLDVLLGEKISFARESGIQVDCQVHIPQEVSIDEMDLCTVFANGIDNAITACLKQKKTCSSISVSAKLRHEFLLIQIRNSVSTQAEFQYGTGLNNVRRIVDKYHGTMEIQNTEDTFFFHILLCLNH